MSFLELLSDGLFVLLIIMVTMLFIIVIAVIALVLLAVLAPEWFIENIRGVGNI